MLHPEDQGDGDGRCLGQNSREHGARHAARLEARQDMPRMATAITPDTSRCASSSSLPMMPTARAKRKAAVAMAMATTR